MSSPADLYVNGMRKKFRNYFAAWLPSEKFRLGDVGILQGNFFTRVTTLEDPRLGVAFTERPDPDSSPIDLVSESGVSVSFKASGEVNPSAPHLPEGKAGAAVEFSRQGAFVFNAPESYEPSIENIVDVQDAILEAYREGRWKSNWAVIVRVVQTPSATVLVSQSSTAKIELAADAEVDAGSFELGSANLNLGIRHQSGDVLKVLAAQNITPLFQLARIKRRFLAPDVVAMTRAGKRTVSPLDALTPELVRTNRDVAASLYLDLVTEAEDVLPA